MNRATVIARSAVSSRERIRELNEGHELLVAVE
jgi:hypothetical protein